MPAPYDVVHFPCEEETWQHVKALLYQIKDYAADVENCNLEELAILHQEAVNVGQYSEEFTPFGNCLFYGLVKFLRKSASIEEKRKFLQTTFPTIVSLAVQLENVIPRSGLAYSKQEEGGSAVLSRKFIASILACAFLCLFPDRGKTHKKKDARLNVINFSMFFRMLPCPSQNAKLRCILSYFDRIEKDGQCPVGSVIFSRQVIPLQEVPTIDTWLNCNVALCPVIVHHDGVIEDSGCEAIHVDFANRFIGGGVLGGGRVQEEIKFCVCPELLASLLFMECMKSNEAIIIQGYEQFSEIEGYAASLQFAGDFHDPSLRDERGLLMNTLCAIDAVSYGGSPNKQYCDNAVLRDLNKAYIGFCCDTEHVEVKSEENLQVDTTNTDDEYFSADEEDKQGRIAARHDEGIYEDFANYFSKTVISSALTEVVQIFRDSKLQNSNIIKMESAEDGNNGSVTELDHYEDDGMDHLDIDYHEWLAHFQRRSSAISTISDIPSRKSSCSTRLSSDYSSEFEEYDNFQRREYHIIKEEFGSSLINDFALMLATQLLKDGTTVAALMAPGVQNFDNNLPIPEEVSKPMPVRQAPSADRTEIFVSEDVARRFADQFFPEIWPFPISQESENGIDDIQQLYSSRIIQLEDSKENSNSNEHEIMNVDSTESVEFFGASQQLDEFEKYAAIFVDQIVGDLLVSENVLVQSTTENVESSTDLVDSYNDNVVCHPPLLETLSPIDRDVGFPLEIEQNSHIEEQLSTKCPDGKCFRFADKLVTQIFQSLSTEFSESAKQSKRHVFRDVSPESLSMQSDNIVHGSPFFKSEESWTTTDIPQSQTLLTAELKCDRLEIKTLSDRATDTKFYQPQAEKHGNSDFCPNSLEQSVCRSLENTTNGSLTPSSNLEHNHQQIRGNNQDKPLLIAEQIKSNQENLPPSDSNFESDHLRSSSTGSSSENGPKMDYFASVLSRDLLTNAFLEVQMTTHQSSCLRRSSEPFKFTNNTAMQLFVQKNAERGRKGRPTSKTEEDMLLFCRRFSYDPTRRRSLDSIAYERRRSSSGFRDLTLSRFAEELMKTKCNIPKFHIFESSNRSTSDSSCSRRSSIRSSVSGFRDPVLAGFEDELLSTSSSQSSKSSFSKYKISSRLSKQYSFCDSWSSLSGTKSVSFESEYSSKSCTSTKSSSPFVDNVSLYADQLANSIVLEAFSVVFGNVLDKVSSLRRQLNNHEVEEFSDTMACSILYDVLSSIGKKDTADIWANDFSKAENSVRSNHRGSCASTTSSQFEYEDALDVPIFLLEDYADQIAHTVLWSSVNIWQREVESEKRRLNGRPIASGNWGCGAFRGDPHLKSILQWMAASYSGVPLLLFYSFSSPMMIKFEEVVETLTVRGWTVGQLMQAVRRYCELMNNQNSIYGDNALDFFNILLSDTLFPGVTLQS